MAKTIQKTKLVYKDICNPKKISAEFKGGEEVVGGSLIGMVTKIVRGKAKAKDGLTDVETVGLGGTFEGIPADPEGTTVQSGVCYMPASFQDQIIDILEVQEPIKDDKDKVIGFRWVRNPEWNGQPIQIAAEVLVTHATNPQGYSWALQNVIAAKHVDPLAELRKALAAPKTAAALADQTTAKGKEKAKA